MGGRPRTLRNAFVTADGYQVGSVVCVHAKDMKEPWCLAASTTTDTAKQLMTTYGKRWSIESGFRDTKDLRFGMGMASIRVSTPERRDRLWLLNAFAVVLLTLLGAAGEISVMVGVISSPTPHQTALAHSLFPIKAALQRAYTSTMPLPRLRHLRSGSAGASGAKSLCLPAHTLAPSENGGIHEIGDSLEPEPLVDAGLFRRKHGLVSRSV